MEFFDSYNFLSTVSRWKTWCVLTPKPSRWFVNFLGFVWQLLSFKQQINEKAWKLAQNDVANLTKVIDWAPSHIPPFRCSSNKHPKIAFFVSKEIIPLCLFARSHNQPQKFGPLKPVYLFIRTKLCLPCLPLTKSSRSLKNAGISTDSPQNSRYFINWAVMENVF